MIKSQIFALSFMLFFMPGLPDAATKASPKAKPAVTSAKKAAPKAKAPATKAAKARKAKAPAAFRGFSGADLKKLKMASSRVSEAKMSKKGEVAKTDSTLTWEYVLIFLVIAGGAAITLLVIH